MAATAIQTATNGNIYCFGLLRRAASGNGADLADSSNHHLLHFLLKYLRGESCAGLD
jgi:hypothetical protein